MRSKQKGPKTLYVQAEQNWPAAGATNYPSIPLDVRVEISAESGSVWSKRIIPLPNNGLMFYITCDDLIVDAHYSADQALGTPYPSYLISGGFIAGYVPREPVGWTNKYTSAGVLPVGGAWQNIPQFANEVRVISNSYGTLSVREFAGVPVSTWSLRYDLQALNNWTSLPPLSYQWRAEIQHLPYNVTNAHCTVEFR